MDISVHGSSTEINTPVCAETVTCTILLSVLHGTSIEHKWLVDENISHWLIGTTHARILTSTNFSVSSRLLSSLWKLSHCLMDTLECFFVFPLYM